MINTPMKPTETANHCPRVTLSPSSNADSAVTINGARKLTAVAAARGIYLRLAVNSSVVASRHKARNNCNPGRLVRMMRNPLRGMNTPAISSVCIR